LYDEGSAAFVSNVGSLVEPITREQFKKGGAAKCVGLFSHSDQANAAQTLKCQITGSSPKGGGGRLADQLASQGFRTASYSMAGTSVWSVGENTHTQIIHKKNGAVRFTKYEEQRYVLGNITMQQHGNVYGQEYAKQLRDAIDSSESLGQILEGTTLQTTYKTEGSLAQQFHQVARLIASREQRKVERDIYYVNWGGWDFHSDVNENLQEKFAELDAAIGGFVAELKAQSIFDSTVLVMQSDFGRSLTSNGAGTDHAWAGNTFIVGGKVQGGRVYNDFPKTLLEGSDQDAGRGRLIPKYPWETMMVPVAEWMGADSAGHPQIFPNLANFNESLIIKRSLLFAS
jgi:uncharacterized protein (DUF1501 family)